MYFITLASGFGKRQPSRYKVECEGTMMVSLCSKSYCVYDDKGGITPQQQKKAAKYSAKGIQHSNFLDNDESEIYEIYSYVLLSSPNDSAKSGIATNRGLKRKFDKMIVYEKDKVMFNSFYCKHQVLADVIHTRPLDL